MVAPGTLVGMMVVGVMAGMESVGAKSMLGDGSDVAVEVASGAGVEAWLVVAVIMAVEEGVRIGSTLPHRSLPQAVRIIAAARNRARILPVRAMLVFISGELYPSPLAARMKMG